MSGNRQPTTGLLQSLESKPFHTRAIRGCELFHGAGSSTLYSYFLCRHARTMLVNVGCVLVFSNYKVLSPTYGDSDPAVWGWALGISIF